MGRSPNLFLETLTHPSSWVLKSPLHQRPSRRTSSETPRQRGPALDALAEEEGNGLAEEFLEVQEGEPEGVASQRGEAAEEGRASAAERPMLKSPFDRKDGEDPQMAWSAG